MYILGINLSHHASLCLLEDGKNIFYLEYDRISGKKEQEFCLNDPIEPLEDILKYTNHVDYLIFSSFGKNRRYPNSDASLIEYIKSKLNEHNITVGEIHFYNEHHLYHATHAFYSCNFDEAAVLVLDGGGVQYNDYIINREMESMYYFSNIGYNIVKKNYGSSDLFCSDKPEKHRENIIFSSSLSCGGLFNSLTNISTIEAGKLMGLSSYGNSSKIESGDWFNYSEECDVWFTNNREILDCYIKYFDNVHLDNLAFGHSQFRHFGDESRMYQVIANLAKKLQDETKNHTIRLIREILEKTGSKNLVLSGGYMLNCVNNYEYLKEFPDINFYVDPISHDGGTCMGAAKYLWHCVLRNEKRDILETLYLG